MTPRQFFEKSVANHPPTQRHISADLKPQPRRRQNFRTWTVHKISKHMETADSCTHPFDSCSTTFHQLQAQQFAHAHNKLQRSHNDTSRSPAHTGPVSPILTTQRDGRMENRQSNPGGNGYTHSELFLGCSTVGACS
jgi:hypothetical protein